MWACSCLRRFPACTLSWLPWLPHVHDRFVEAGTQYFIVVDGQSHTSGDFNLTLQLSVSLGLQGGGRGGGGQVCTLPSECAGAAQSHGGSAPALVQPPLPGQTFDDAIDLGSNVTASVSSATAPYVNSYQSKDCGGSGPDVVSMGRAAARSMVGCCSPLSMRRTCAFTSPPSFSALLGLQVARAVPRHAVADALR